MYNTIQIFHFLKHIFTQILANSWHWYRKKRKMIYIVLGYKDHYEWKLWGSNSLSFQLKWQNLIRFYLEWASLMPNCSCTEKALQWKSLILVQGEGLGTAHFNPCTTISCWPYHWLLGCTLAYCIPATYVLCNWHTLQICIKTFWTLEINHRKQFRPEDCPKS